MQIKMQNVSTDAERAAFIAVSIARDDLVRISAPISRRSYGDNYDRARELAVVALEKATAEYAKFSK